MSRIHRPAGVRALVAAVCVSLGLSLHAGQAPFRGGVDLVVLTVTATGPGGKYVTDLKAEDFTVLEDGKPQQVDLFERANTPLAVSILLDSSTSMFRELPLAQKAASDFVTRLKPGDVAQVIDFDRRVEVLQKFTADREALDRAIYRVAARGSTSMYNAIYIALKDLKKVVATSVEDIRRQAVVVLSDGEDTSSLLPFEEVLDLAKRSETAIYAIGLRSNEGSGASRGFREAEFVLRQLSQETGGRAFFPNAVAELPAIYKQISEELSSQYTVGYSSRNAKRDGAWRRVVVRIDRPGVAARTKQGYFGPTVSRKP